MNLQEINQMYEQTNKDMPREEFVKRLQAATSSTGMQRDAMKIVAMNRKKQIIDEVVRSN